ncbi:unnamed protein product [Miscanthus lutarioriparius]|uniref:Uncharacterized protein n=1 Tax=Miscanthus lutarioriparius TaxID=422564 RepID=A0A811S7G8_9POAL|nr:unnamed protein product [Miscanthus lutarioriparius]
MERYFSKKDVSKISPKNDDTCANYWFEDQYLAYLRANHLDKLRDMEVEGVHGPFVAPAVQGIEQKSDTKIGMMDLKVQIIELKVDILKLEQEIKELKNGGLNKAFSLGNALVDVVMLNLFVSLLVAAVWK